jgi:hypothetical protein
MNNRQVIEKNCWHKPRKMQQQACVTPLEDLQRKQWLVFTQPEVDKLLSFSTYGNK